MKTRIRRSKQNNNKKKRNKKGNTLKPFQSICASIYFFGGKKLPQKKANKQIFVYLFFVDSLVLHYQYEASTTVHTRTQTPQTMIQSICNMRCTYALCMLYEIFISSDWMVIVIYYRWVCYAHTFFRYRNHHRYWAMPAIESQPAGRCFFISVCKRITSVLCTCRSIGYDWYWLAIEHYASPYYGLLLVANSVVLCDAWAQQRCGIGHHPFPTRSAYFVT